MFLKIHVAHRVIKLTQSLALGDWQVTTGPGSGLTGCRAARCTGCRASNTAFLQEGSPAHQHPCLSGTRTVKGLPPNTILPEPRRRHWYSMSCILRFLLEFCFHYTGHQPEIMKTRESDKNSSRPSRPPMPQCGPGRASAPSGFWTSLEEATAALGLSDSSGSPAGQWLGRTTTQVRVSCTFAFTMG